MDITPGPFTASKITHPITLEAMEQITFKTHGAEIDGATSAIVMQLLTAIRSLETEVNSLRPDTPEPSTPQIHSWPAEQEAALDVQHAERGSL